MANAHSTVLIVLGLCLFAAGSASATPPSGFDCVGGYNPTAWTNVCYKPTSSTYTVYSGTVTTTTQEVCIIGNLCEDVPMPSYSPSGGTPIVVPLIGFELYYEVFGAQVLTECPAHAGGQGIFLTTEAACLYETEVEGEPQTCLSFLEGPERVCLHGGPGQMCLRTYTTETSYVPACFSVDLATQSLCIWAGRGAAVVGLCMVTTSDGAARCFSMFGTIDQDLGCY